MSSVLPEVPPLERAPVDWERHRGNKSPKILPPPGEVWRNPATKRKVGHRYYTRVTTFADAITESYNLTAWKLRRLLYGASQRRDYVTAAASLTLEDRDRDALDELVGLCLEAAGPSASLLGTALHSITERSDRDEDLGEVPAEVVPDLAAYVALTSGLIAYRHREARVVCDQLECAGTPDGHAHIAEPCPAGCGPEVLHIIDTKTGSIRYPGKMSTQLAIYAHSDLYDPATGQRTPVEVCRKWGAIIHLPVETGEAAAFWLDLEHGWRGAELCGPVRTWHRAKADDILRPFESVQAVRVVDGEVTRFETRLASYNAKSPTERPAQLDAGDITAALEASIAAVASTPEPATLERDDEGDEAALHEDLAPATAYGPHVAAGPDEDGRCTTCGLTEDDGRAEHVDEVRAAFAEAAQRERPLELPGPVRNPLRVRCETTDLLVEGCGCPKHRPDLVHVSDEGVEPDEGPTEYPNESWSSVDEGAPEQDGTYPDAEPVEPFDEPLRADDGRPLNVRGEPVGPEPDPLAGMAGDPYHPEWPVDPLADEIRSSITVRDLELLGTRRWHEWSEQHRALAVEQHDRLERAEREAKPVAAFEAAVAAATTRAELLEVMKASDGASWFTSTLEQLATARWSELVPR